MRVRVPFATKTRIGVVLNNPKSSDFLDKLKPIEAVLDEVPIMPKAMLDLLNWATQYYHHPIGEVVFSALPKNLRLGKTAVIKKIPKASQQQHSNIVPNGHQQQAIDAVLKVQNQYQSFLLHGITGSGKTEVYIRLSQAILACGKQVLLLVPEIGLTPQMVARFSTRLNTTIVLVHSQLSATQKTDAYLLAQSAKANLVLGTRSAIFTPLLNLGLIIVDEEHDDSFKQQSDWRYSAKELSFMRAKQANIPLLLGSATPSLQILHSVLAKKVQLLSLTERAGLASLPTISLIDMNNKAQAVLSETLLVKIKQHLHNKQQVMLFINRRGYAPVFHCTNCPWQASCTACSANMVLHQASYRLRCHHCGLETMPPTHCPNCKEKQLYITGYGTERLTEVLYTHFPDTEIIRIDKDTTTSKTAMAKYLAKITSGKPCIIVGTQMLAKGHDFSQLSLVGVLDADNSLFSADFRAGEKLVQLLMQVAGRAGRAEQVGQVFIQTRQSEHVIFNYVKSHQYLAFAKYLLAQRQQAMLPPFVHQALICANAKQAENAQKFLSELKKILQKAKISAVDIWGPAPAMIEKKANYYYYNLYLISQNRQQLHRLLNPLHHYIAQLPSRQKVRWFLDINPI